jgi:aminoglycoside/choline kinase family phosphotransferase
LKESEVIDLAAHCSYECERAVALKLEASGREYWRLIHEQNSFVLCYLDKSIGNHDQFCYLSQFFENQNINASRVLIHRPELGVTIQEDLGNDDLLEILNDSNRTDLIHKSLDLLVRVQEIENLNIHKLLKSALLEQINLFSEVFCRDFLEINPDESIKDLSLGTIENIAKQPYLNCHFDFERRNLIASQDRTLSVIDFQDLCIGPIGIDLAGILLDHYEPFDKNFVKQSLEFYKNRSALSLDEDELYECFRWGGIQRNMRILGTLSRLYLEQNRSFRLNDLTMILDNLINIIPDGWSCKDYMIESIQPQLEKRLALI